MSELFVILGKTPTGILILIVICCLGSIGGLFKLTMYFAKATASKILNEIKTDLKELIGKVDLIEINTKAMNNALGEVLNGDYKTRFSTEKEKLIEDVRFLRNNP